MYNLEILEKGCEELGITLNDTQKTSSSSSTNTL